MFVYEKKLQYPVKVATPNPKLAAVIISQYGGPDGELGASLRYLSQRYSMPYPELKGLLTDIGTEELGHLEMIGTLVHQLTRNLTEEQIKTAGFDAYFVDHTPPAIPGPPPPCRSPATPSRTSLRILPQSRRPVSPTTTSYAFPTIPMSTMPSSSSGNGRLSTSRDLARRCVWPRSG